MKYRLAKRKLKIKNYITELFILAIGCAVMAVATSFFLLPNQLSSGGFTGIATITYYLFRWPLGMVIFTLNIPLLIVGYFRIGRKFTIKTLIGILLLSIFIDFFDRFPPLTTDRFLGCIYGGIISGIGNALVLKSESSTGGTDLSTYIIRTFKPNFRPSSLIVGIDIIIILLNTFFFRNIEIGLYSAIAIYLTGKMIDIVFEGVYFTKMMFIISEKYDKISREIGKKVSRGSTGIYAKGMYTNKDKMMLLCVGSRNEVAKIKRVALSIDSKAFIIISNAREAWGKGFKKE